jgi:hypothetical protein
VAACPALDHSGQLWLEREADFYSVETIVTLGLVKQLDLDLVIQCHPSALLYSQEHGQAQAITHCVPVVLAARPAA